ncbi:MAG: hypothetical protein ACFE7R_05830, partial [Candidatus Hodarchaeota archaeon]
MRKPAISLMLFMIFLLPSVGGPKFNGAIPPLDERRSRTTDFGSAGWQDTSSGTGAPRAVDFQGLTTSSGTSVIDATNPGYIGIEPPLGWSSEELEGELDHLSMWIDGVLANPSLDAYEVERWFFTGSDSQYNSDPFFVPSGWTITKNDVISSGTQHPQHGAFELDGAANLGYDGTMGWRFEANMGSGYTINPSNEIRISNQIPARWREVYSAEITFLYYVSSVSTLNNEFFVFTELEGYTSQHHVFEIGTPMDTWLQATASVPTSYLHSLEIHDSLLFSIGVGTDLSGEPASADHEVLIDEIDLRLLVRPYPEQIDLRANGAFVTGSAQGSVNPYVPDGSNRDCYSAPDSNGGAGGVDLNGYSDLGWLDVGADVPDYPDWTTAFQYQVGLQFPLHVPQGSAITSAILELETPGDSVGFPGMRIYVADED